VTAGKRRIKMNIFLLKAEIQDAKIIHEMQIKSFAPLLEKYQDFDTSPANESMGKIVERINQPLTDYYIINDDSVAVGVVRVVKKDNKLYRVSPIFVLPEHQMKGIAQKAFEMLEQIYYDAEVWELDTILQEQGNCYLYEKLGYKKIGKTKSINDKMTLVFYEKHCVIPT
jgi:GNAT superfamily N-acetyltransferase